MKSFSEKWVLILLGWGVTLFFAALLYFSFPGMQKPLYFLQNIFYDYTVRHYNRKLDKNSPVVIVDIDDASIAKKGKWPWNRNQLAELIQELHQLGAKVVASDMIFPEKEENVVDTLLKKVEKIGGASLDTQSLNTLKQSLDGDKDLAKALSLGSSVLGITFKKKGTSEGFLPEPLFAIPPNIKDSISLPNWPVYLANIAVLQDAAKMGGSINAALDEDGILRFSPMIIRNNQNVFPSLSLATVYLFLDRPEFKVLLGDYKEGELIEGIQLGTRTIPLDRWGRILVPFRGPSYSTPYFSAADVLDKKIKKEEIEGKIVFFGASATAIGDLVATSVSPIFVGIEVHAQIAASILDGYLPHRPLWEKGMRLILLLSIGLSLATLLPFLGPIVTFFVTAILVGGLFYFSQYVWIKENIFFSTILPILNALIIFLINEIAGYLFERKRRKNIRQVFDQYVPPEYLKQMFEEKKKLSLEGESKELSVLFSDIWHFTSIAESLNANEIKKMLNEYLSPMTQVIFNHQGTIDKYIGDLIMAFWGAPVEDPDHAIKAVRTSLAMQKKLGEINQTLQSKIKEKLRIGIGINTGTMNVGDMGSEYRKAYTVIGDEVNLASRTESLTRIYEVNVIITQNTFEKTKSVFFHRLLDKVKVKGKEKAILIYEPICEQMEANEAIKTQLDQHHKALNAYFEKRFDEAESSFTSMKGQGKLYDLYLTRIAEFKKNPPPQDWDGTFVLESK